MKFQCGCAVSHTAEMAHLKVKSVLVLVADVGVMSFFLSNRFACLAPHCSSLFFPLGKSLLLFIIGYKLSGVPQ